jgi:hypothetical protein
VAGWQAETYWQVWLAAATWPAVALMVVVGIRLFSGGWPLLDAFGAIGTVGYVYVRGIAGSHALRTRRKILGLTATPDRGPEPSS